MYLTLHSFGWYLRESNTPFSISDLSNKVPGRETVVQLNEFGQSLFVSGFIVLGVLSNKKELNSFKEFEEKYKVFLRKSRPIEIDSFARKQNWGIIFRVLNQNRTYRAIVNENTKRQILQKNSGGNIALTKFVHEFFAIVGGIAGNSTKRRKKRESPTEPSPLFKKKNPRIFKPKRSENSENSKKAKKKVESPGPLNVPSTLKNLYMNSSGQREVKSFSEDSPNNSNRPILRSKSNSARLANDNSMESSEEEEDQIFESLDLTKVENEVIFRTPSAEDMFGGEETRRRRKFDLGDLRSLSQMGSRYASPRDNPGENYNKEEEDLKKVAKLLALENALQNKNDPKNKLMVDSVNLSSSVKSQDFTNTSESDFVPVRRVRREKTPAGSMMGSFDDDEVRMSDEFVQSKTNFELTNPEREDEIIDLESKVLYSESGSSEERESGSEEGGDVESANSCSEFVQFCLEKSFKKINWQKSIELMTERRDRLNEIFRNYSATFREKNDCNVVKMMENVLTHVQRLRSLLQEEQENEKRRKKSSSTHVGEESQKTLRILSFGFESDSPKVVELTVGVFSAIRGIFNRKQLWLSISSNEGNAQTPISLGDVLLFSIERNCFNKELRGKLVDIFCRVMCGRYASMFFEIERRFENKLDFLILLKEILQRINVLVFEPFNSREIDDLDVDQDSNSLSSRMRVREYKTNLGVRDVKKRDNLLKILVSYCIVLIDKMDDSKEDEKKLFEYSVSMILECLNNGDEDLTLDVSEENEVEKEIPLGLNGSKAVCAVFKDTNLVDKLHSKVDQFMKFRGDIKIIKLIMDIFWGIIETSQGIEIDEEVTRIFYNIALGCVGYNEEIKNYVVRNSLKLLNGVKASDFPVKFLLDKLFPVIFKTGYTKLDFSLLTALANYSSLSVSEGMTIVRNISEVCVKRSLFSVRGIVCFITILKRFKNEKRIVKFLDKFCVKTLSVVFDLENSATYFDKENIIKTITELIKLKSSVVNKRIERTLRKVLSLNRELEFSEVYQNFRRLLDSTKMEVFDKLDGENWMNEIETPLEKFRNPNIDDILRKYKTKGRSLRMARKKKMIFEGQKVKPVSQPVSIYGRRKRRYKTNALDALTAAAGVLPTSKSERGYSKEVKDEIIDNIVLPNLKGRRKKGSSRKRKSSEPLPRKNNYRRRDSESKESVTRKRNSSAKENNYRRRDSESKESVPRKNKLSKKKHYERRDFSKVHLVNNNHKHDTNDLMVYRDKKMKRPRDRGYLNKINEMLEKQKEEKMKMELEEAKDKELELLRKEKDEIRRAQRQRELKKKLRKLKAQKRDEQLAEERGKQKELEIERLNRIKEKEIEKKNRERKAQKVLEYQRKKEEMARKERMKKLEQIRFEKQEEKLKLRKKQLKTKERLRKMREEKENLRKKLEEFES